MMEKKEKESGVSAISLLQSITRKKISASCYFHNRQTKTLAPMLYRHSLGKAQTSRYMDPKSTQQENHSPLRATNTLYTSKTHKYT